MTVVNEGQENPNCGDFTRAATSRVQSSQFSVSGRVHTDTSAKSPGSYVRVIINEFACIPIAAVHDNTGSVYEYQLT